MPLKIVLCVGWYYPESQGGTEVYVSELALKLRSLGHSVLIFAPQKGEHVESYEHQGVTVFRYPIPDHPTRAEMRSDVLPRNFEKFISLLADAHADIVHFHTIFWAAGIHHVKAAMNAGAATVITTHTPGLGYLCPRGTGMIWGKQRCDGIVRPARCGACLLQQRGIPRGLGYAIGGIPPAWSARWESLAGNGKFAAAIGTSGFIEKRLQLQNELTSTVGALVTLTSWGHEILLENDADPNKLSICRLGVSQMTPAAGGSSGAELVVGYIGRLDPIKGVHFLIEAFKKIPKAAKICLKIYGVSAVDGVYAQRLKRAAGAESRIQFHEGVPHSRLPEILGGLDVLAIPSVCMEGGPTILLEALACKLPVIGSDIGAIPEYIQHEKNGLIFRPGDAGSIHRTLERLLKNKELLQKLKSGIDDVRSMEQIGQEMDILYKELVQR